jgi:hypothetical protein
MLAAQAGCSPDAALVLMNERADASDRTLEAVAVAVLERDIRFG